MSHLATSSYSSVFVEIPLSPIMFLDPPSPLSCIIYFSSMFFISLSEIIFPILCLPVYYHLSFPLECKFHDDRDLACLIHCLVYYKLWLIIHISVFINEARAGAISQRALYVMLYLTWHGIISQRHLKPLRNGISRLAYLLKKTLQRKKYLN